MSLRERHNNFVVPAPRPQVEIATVQPELPAPPTTVLLPHAGYEDRARGFGIATAPLAGIAGIVAALVGIVGWQVPVASLITLLLALGGFAVVWLIAYIAHTLISPDGALFLHTLFTWGYLRREQTERIRRYRGVNRE
jgi:phage shock protein PspC (stress-responsive transcriptional regulator)